MTVLNYSYLKVRETNRLAQSTTENIIKDVDSLYEVALSGIHDAVSTALRNSGVDPQEICGLDDIFNPLGPYGKLFPGLDTHYLQMKYLRQNFKFVVSNQHQSTSILVQALLEAAGFRQSDSRLLSQDNMGTGTTNIHYLHLYLGTYHDQSWVCTKSKGHRC